MTAAVWLRSVVHHSKQFGNERVLKSFNKSEAMLRIRDVMSRAGYLLLFSIFTIQYSATSKPLFTIAIPILFLKIAICYSLFAITTFALSVLQTA
jgi:succinate-acetate transporter protein